MSHCPECSSFTRHCYDCVDLLVAENARLVSAIKFLQTLECMSSFRPCVCCATHSKQLGKFVNTTNDDTKESIDE